ncbi:hypothetical protein BKA70DRAFT_1241868 [Coprinopsis sp. MPI-PUGE-AT-0042]|nr:hypothetical protein BKA70DRAFT_1241868 [Coprinopsis sp. MPI-PUGE-AT-0042]
MFQFLGTAQVGNRTLLANRALDITAEFCLSGWQVGGRADESGRRSVKGVLKARRRMNRSTNGAIVKNFLWGIIRNKGEGSQSVVGNFSIGHLESEDFMTWELNPQNGLPVHYARAAAGEARNDQCSNGTIHIVLGEWNAGRSGGGENGECFKYPRSLEVERVVVGPKLVQAKRVPRCAYVAPRGSNPLPKAPLLHRLKDYSGASSNYLSTER